MSVVTMATHKPWENEPDRLEWEHAGLQCLILRGPLGNLCGYVGLPPGHPLYGVEPDSECEPLGGRSINDVVDVHGGITFAGWGDKWRPHGFWWLGFDCAHLGDLVPGIRAFGWEEYKDINYVKAETERLAEQLAAIV